MRAEANPLFSGRVAAAERLFAGATKVPAQLAVHFAGGIGNNGSGWTREQPEKAATNGRFVLMSLIRQGGFAVGAIVFAGLAGLLGSAAADTAPVKLAANPVASAPVTAAATPD